MHNLIQRMKDETEQIESSVGRELKENPPSIVASTRRKFGPERARKQTIAIMLNKSRRMGAKIPKPKNLGSY